MDLFEMRDGIVYPTVHALLISPFREIWALDREDGKPETLRKMRYVELLCSPKKSNIYYNYAEDIRPEKVKKEVFGDENHPIDSDIVNMTIKYKELLNDASPYYQELQTGEHALSKLRIFIHNFNPAERTNSGSLVLKPKELALAIEGLPGARESVEKLRDKLVSDIAQQETKTKKDREIGMYEE
jgi:hypothetical protein